MWWPPVASSVEKSTTPSRSRDTPVVPWPMSMMVPSVTPRARAADTGSSTTSHGVSSQASSTLVNTFTVPSLIPGGMVTAASVKVWPSLSWISVRISRTLVTAPSQSTTMPSRTTFACRQPPVTGRLLLSTTANTMLAVPRSTASRSPLRLAFLCATFPVRTSSANRLILVWGFIVIVIGPDRSSRSRRSWLRRRCPRRCRGAAPPGRSP